MILFFELPMNQQPNVTASKRTEKYPGGLVFDAPGSVIGVKCVGKAFAADFFAECTIYDRSVWSWAGENNGVLGYWADCEDASTTVRCRLKAYERRVHTRYDLNEKGGCGLDVASE